MHKILLLLTAVFFFSVNPAMAIEEPRFKIVKQEDAFQLRDYETYVILSIDVESTKDEAVDAAFEPLLDYISGANTARQSYAMTEPVGQVFTDDIGTKFDMTVPVGQTSNKNGTHKVYFVLPDGVTSRSAPKPNDPRLSIEQIPAQRVAAITYSGYSSIEDYEDNRDKLQAWIKDNNLEIIGKPIYARYNPPWTLWFARRNEVLIEVK